MKQLCDTVPCTSTIATAAVGVSLNVLCFLSKATPAPPVGPAIGAFGLNIAMFVKEIGHRLCMLKWHC